MSRSPSSTHSPNNAPIRTTGHRGEPLLGRRCLIICSCPERLSIIVASLNCWFAASLFFLTRAPEIVCLCVHRNSLRSTWTSARSGMRSRSSVIISQNSNLDSMKRRMSKNQTKPPCLRKTRPKKRRRPISRQRPRKSHRPPRPKKRATKNTGAKERTRQKQTALKIPPD
jgi:hypothetical protein